MRESEKNIIFSKLKQFGLLFLSFLILFFISANNYKTAQINRINRISQINMINEEKTSPRELFLDVWKIIKSNYYLSNLNRQNWSYWKKRYFHQIKTQEDAYVAINSMLASLNDPYSKFMSEDEFIEQNNSIKPKLYGIGINIASISGKIYIVNVLKNAPADNQGIRAGDIILKVDGIDVNGQSIYQTAQLIRGTSGTSLNLEILRGGQKFERVVKRSAIKVKKTDYKKLTKDIGYIRISSFIGVDMPKEFTIALNRLKDTKALIIDLRGNSGGLFQNAIVISNLFMKKGIIVNVIARQGHKNVYSAVNEGCVYDNPLVILIDGSSASSSEILASALQDNKRAVLVGTRTYGKGLVQKIFSLPNKTGMNLTIARYLTQSGKDINKKGIEPDYTVVFSHSDFINNFDPQLTFAQEYLEKKISKNEL